MNSKIRGRISVVLYILVCIIAIPSIPVFATFVQNFGSNYYGVCAYSNAANTTNAGTCGITISNNGFTLFLSVNPVPSGNCTIQSDQVTVNTYDPTGFTLTLGDETTTTSLVNAIINTIPATTGTTSSPLALSDTWGYRVDSRSGFGPGPTSAETNAAPDGSILFAGIKASNLTADTIAQTASRNPSVATTVWYGVCIDTSLGLPAGPYSNTVIYTATSN